MIKQIHIHQKVEKDLAQMTTLESAPAVAASRARAIIDALFQGVSASQAGRFSKSKDARVKNLLKYNLGKGYRLLTIKEKHQMFILFMGDHDQCDRWLDANRRKTPHHRPLPMSVYDVCCPVVQKENNTMPQQHASDPDLSSISQKDLRRVFSGLVN